MAIETEARSPIIYPVYKYDGSYSRGEIEQVGKFMNSDFLSVTIEANRGMKFKVEYPPSSICGPHTWNYYLDKILKPEIEDLHPKFRKSPTIVRFAPILEDARDGVQAGATGNVRDEGYWVRISYMAPKNREKDPVELLFLMMHEITEHDFWAKTLKNDNQAHVGGKVEMEYFKSLNSANYRNLLDEKVANRRALKAIRRVFTDSSLIHEYDEDL